EFRFVFEIQPWHFQECTQFLRVDARGVGHRVQQQTRRVLDGEQIEEALQCIRRFMKMGMLEIVLHFNHPAAITEGSERVRKDPITLHAPMLDAFFSFLSHRPPRDFLLCAFADALFPSTDSGELNGKGKLSEAGRVLRDFANLIVRCFRGNTASTKAPSSSTKLQAPSTNHQAPSSKLQAPSSKLQRSSKAQAPNPGASDGGAIRRRRVEVWGLELLWSLELGIWSFSESL